MTDDVIKEGDIEKRWDRYGSGKRSDKWMKDESDGMREPFSIKGAWKSKGREEMIFEEDAKERKKESNRKGSEEQKEKG